eukprot:gene5562-9380_t
MSLKVIPKEELKKHCKGDEEQWIVIEGRVIDITKFKYEHPGGIDLLLEHAGEENSLESYENIGHSDEAKLELHEYIIGILEGYERVKENVLSVNNKYDDIFGEFLEDPLLCLKPFYSSKQEALFQFFYTKYQNYISRKEDNEHLDRLLYKNVKNFQHDINIDESDLRDHRKMFENQFIEKIITAKNNLKLSKELRRKVMKLVEEKVDDTTNNKLTEESILKIVVTEIFQEWIEMKSDFMTELDELIEFDADILLVKQLKCSHIDLSKYFKELEASFELLEKYLSKSSDSDFDAMSLFFENEKFKQENELLKKQIQMLKSQNEIEKKE